MPSMRTNQSICLVEPVSYIDLSPTPLTIPAFVVLMSPITNRKLSGLSGLDLQHAYGSLLKVKITIVYEESEEDSEVDQQVDTVLSLLRSKPEEPQV